MVGPWDFGQDSNSFNNTYGYGHPRKTTLDLLSSAITRNRSKPITVQAATGQRMFSKYKVKKEIYATAWDDDVVIRADLNGDVLRVVPNKAAPSFSSPVDRMSNSPAATKPSEWPAKASPSQPGRRFLRRLMRRW